MLFKKICAKVEIKDYRRFRWFFWLLLLGLLSLGYFYFYKDKFFYIEAINGIGNVYRFFWVLPFSFMGFSFLAFYVARKGLTSDTSPQNTRLCLVV